MRIGLPRIPLRTGFGDGTCVFLLPHPWTVAAWSLDGFELWRKKIPTSWGTPPRLCIGARGESWVSSGRLLFDPTSDETIDVAAGILEFTCMPDGFMLALKGDPISIARIRRDGTMVWRTDLAPPEEIAYAGIVQWEAATGFQPRQVPPWRPRSWDMRLVKDPIVVGERLVVVGAGDYESGLSCRYALALDTGQVAWRTEPAPWSHATSIGEGWFLGQQGYGAFEVSRVIEDGTVVDKWPVDGYVTRLPSGAIHVIELENILPSRMHASALLDGRVVKRGPHLDGYRTSRPALTVDGELIFWRNDELQVVDAELRRRTLDRAPAQDEAEFPSDMHLGRAGMLAFTLGDALWIAESAFRPFSHE